MVQNRAVCEASSSPYSILVSIYGFEHTEDTPLACLGQTFMKMPGGVGEV